MREQALLFGEDKSLVGVVTDPEPGVRPAGRGVLILNAGVLHRVGPNRVHVQLARSLAEAGFVVLRFDLSGLGDSRQAAGNEPFVLRAVRETSQGMDFLSQSRGLSEFLLVGICAGADHGLQAANSDPRVVGAVLIDGYNLPSLGMVLHFYRDKFMSPRSWLRLLLGRSQSWTVFRHVAATHQSSRTVLEKARSTLPTPKEFVAQVRSLVDRGTALLLLYTGTTAAYYNYRKLLRRRLGSWPGRARVSVEHMAESDHVFTLRQNRERLVELIRRWAVGLGGGAGAAPMAR